MRTNTARISPDRPLVAVVTLLLVLAVFVAGFVFSFAGITAAARWTGVPVPVHPLAPLFIDGAILTYTIALAVHRWRGDGTARTLCFLWTFTLISAAVNFAHAAGEQSWDFTRLETWFGSLIATSAPIASLFAADEATRLVLTPEVDRSSSGPVGDDDGVGAQHAAPAPGELEQLAASIGLRGGNDAAGGEAQQHDEPLFVYADDGSIRRRTTASEQPAVQDTPAEATAQLQSTG